MDLGILVPIALFFSIAWTIKAVVDARFRRQMVESNGSQELVRSIMEGDETRRRHASLRWGVLLLTVATGFILIDLAGWDRISPGVIGVLLAATGIGNLLAYAVARKFSTQA